MLPATLLDVELRGGRLVPRFLGAADGPWLRELLDVHLGFVGRRFEDLDERLAMPLCLAVSPSRRRVAEHVLRRLLRERATSAVPPPVARAAVFRKACISAAPRDEILLGVAASLAIAPAALEHALFADLPGERLVAEPEQPLSPEELALRINLALAQSLLQRSSRIRIELEGNARAVVHHARVRGLLVVVGPAEGANRGSDGAILDVSGPLSLFRHTLLYGRRLGDLLPQLAWCRRFRLEADCQLRGRSSTLVLATGDPIFPAPPPRRYDSKLEERFARDFRRLAPDWEILREPEPVRAGNALVFPDFALWHPRDPGRRFLVEIAGFWTTDYLRDKLARYRAAGLPNLVLCIDDQHGDVAAAAPEALPPAVRLVRFRRRVDAAAVLAAITNQEPG